MSIATKHTRSSTAQERPALPRDFRAATEDLYEIFCEARMNVKYYGEKLAEHQKWNLWIEIAIAIGTVATLISLPFISSGGFWQVIPAFFALVAAVLGVLKPILDYPKRIERVSKLWSGYMSAFVSAQSIVRRVKIEQKIDAIEEQAMREIHDKMDSLCVDDDVCPSKDDIDRLQEDVEKAHPPDEFFFPPRTAVM